MTKLLNVQIEVDIEDVEEGEYQGIRVVSVKLDDKQIEEETGNRGYGPHVWPLLTNKDRSYNIVIEAGDL